MIRRENKEVTLKELDKKIDALQKLVTDLYEAQTDFFSFTAEWIEDRRKEASQKDKRLQISLYYQSLLDQI